ncbi:DUF6519 domain-containing protein [Shimia sp.]|uniref:DUF6519 domain-containing protein n=1 Tax=Shimia sp. TaxID=1954381 RepID=UPI003B8E8040
MKGDFTRGFNPDTKRGERYRRVLLQQGRALLDSDMTALSDAIEGSLRQNLAMTACHAGSPDLGLLITPGRLLAQFDSTLGNPVDSIGGAVAVRDYARKYLDRLPGLRMGTNGTVTVHLAEPLAAPTDIRIWAHADNGGASPSVNGTVISVPSGPEYHPVDVSASGAELVFEVDPAARIWVAMIETRAEAGTTPLMHSHSGAYEIEGLAFDTTGGAWPLLADPAGAALQTQAISPADTRLIAYVEVWERLITALEDPGILETALGGDLDTTTRSEVQYQVKLAEVSGVVADNMADAFAQHLLPNGTVTLGVATETITADPCDLPIPGGYTGPENRLYRLEVHGTGAGGATLFKWSRENGSELFAAAFPDTLVIPAPAAALVVQADSDLRDGDLVELLSDAIDLGDAAPATLTPAGFTRPQRAVGRLLRLSGGDEITGSNRVFDLLDPIDETPVVDVDSGRFGHQGLKLRRWSGLILHTADQVFELEQGIEADIAGSFEPGDWWQYEARVSASNANGPTRPAPHGPERLFAPLALLRQTPAAEPMLLERWFDSRFPRLCHIEADDVSYDGARVGSESDTVQEAIDELFERESDAGCGEIPVPEGGDIRDIIDAIPDGGDAKICLGPGTRPVPSVIQVFNKGHITITGIGLGSLLEANRRVFHFQNCNAVTLVDFSARATNGGGHIIQIDDCAAVDIQRLNIQSSTEASHGNAAIRLQANDDRTIRRARIRDCRIALGLNDTAVLAIGVHDLSVSDCDIETRAARFDLRARVADNAFASVVGRVFLSQLSFNVDTNIFVGGSHVSLSNGERGRHTVALGGWGRDPLRFSTHAAMTSRIWDQIGDANPPGNPDGRQPTMRAHVRRIRREVTRAALGLSADITLPTATQGMVNLMGTSLLATSTLEYGQAGIVVSAPFGPEVNGARNPASQITNQLAQSVRINGNRISGFHQGVRIGGDQHVDGLDTRRTFFRDVEVDGNRIDLRIPMYARARWGIMVGSSISVAVRNNRVSNLYDGPMDDIPNPLSPTDGIRVWGVFGDFVQIERNACFGTTHGVRFRALNPQPDPARAVWKVSDVFGDAAMPTNALSGSSGSAEIVEINP